MTTDPIFIRILFWVIALSTSVIIALVGFISTRAYTQLKDLSANLKELNTTLFSFRNEIDKVIGNTREWVLTDFVTKDDHDKAIEDIKEQMDLCRTAHKK